MGLTVSGMLNKQIASELGTSEITVKAASRSGHAQDAGWIVAELVRMTEKLQLVPRPGE